MYDYQIAHITSRGDQLLYTRASCYSCVFSKTRKPQEFSVISDEEPFKPTLHAKFGDHIPQ